MYRIVAFCFCHQGSALKLWKLAFGMIYIYLLSHWLVIAIGHKLTRINGLTTALPSPYVDNGVQTPEECLQLCALACAKTCRSAIYRSDTKSCVRYRANILFQIRFGRLMKKPGHVLFVKMNRGHNLFNSFFGTPVHSCYDAVQKGVISDIEAKGLLSVRTSYKNDTESYRSVYCHGKYTLLYRWSQPDKTMIDSQEAFLNGIGNLCMQFWLGFHNMGIHADQRLELVVNLYGRDDQLMSTFVYKGVRINPYIGKLSLRDAYVSNKHGTNLTRFEGPRKDLYLSFFNNSNPKCTELFGHNFYSKEQECTEQMKYAFNQFEPSCFPKEKPFLYWMGYEGLTLDVFCPYKIEVLYRTLGEGD